MKKNYGMFFSFAVLLTAAMFTLAGCPDPLGDPQTVTYTGTSAGTTVTLTIIENTSRAAYTPQAGDEYELTFGTKESKGVVNSFSAGIFTLKPSNAQAAFTATVSEGGLSALSGTITWTDDSTTAGPEILTPNDPNDLNDETLPELPSSTGTNEVGGKTYETGWEKWEFSADGTYRYFREDDDVWTEEETGNYSWNSSGDFKTVTLAPQRAVVDGTTLYDKAGLKDAVESYFAAEGYTDADVPGMTEGEFTTITAYRDAYADYRFALRLCNYTMSGKTIGTFVEMTGTYGYADAKGGEVVVKNETTGTLTVVTHDADGATNSVSATAGGNSEVFESAADTFLREIEITTTGASITEVDIADGFFSGRSRRFSSTSSFETGPICVGGGRTITITVGGRDEPLPELPSSTGTNEVGGKTYETDRKKWEFSADGTYRYFRKNDGVWAEEETGAYSWNSGGAFKTVTLAPQQTTFESAARGESTLYDKAGLKAALESLAADQGYTDADAAEMTGGQYTTLTAYRDAFADYRFALQLCNYIMSGETIADFVEMGAYDYADAKGGEVVVKNDTIDTLTVVTHDASGATSTFSPSAGESKQVFSSAADTFLREIEIRTTSVAGFTGVEIDKGGLFEGVSSYEFDSVEGSSSGPESFITRSICVGGGRTITITMK